QRVKAVLTGEGADELFAGYDRHKAAWLNERLRALPGWSRASAAALARRAGKGRVFAGLPYGDLGQWAAATASARPGEVAALLHPDLRAVDGAEAALGGSRPLERLEDALAFDLETVLADSLLMKVDKSAMRAGLEARVPFLNRSVVEFALGLPASFKIRRFKGKYLLRLLAERHLPRELAWRRKHGFIVPWERWVRDPGNETLRRLLEGPSLARLGLFDCDRLRRMREALCAGSREFEPGLLFRVAILGLWLESLA
ncbi:MAG: hypothetical protein KGK30_07830, partial [Elusimicrobia bacterium]|nr:hypothetical protein [Elusimicrobiota bacterium]